MTTRDLIPVRCSVTTLFTVKMMERTVLYGRGRNAG